MALSLENWNADYFSANKNECLSHLEDPEFLSCIANLDNLSLDELKDGQLVKFQGMIQDMHNPEIYYEKYLIKNTATEQSDIRSAKYKDMLHINPGEELVESADNISAERQSLIVISVPGLNDWTKNVNENKTKKKFFNDIFDKSVQSINSKKRQQENMEVDETSNLDAANKKGKQTTDKESSTSNQSQEETNFIISKEHMLNLPIPNAKGKSCIVKIYEENSSNLKLNEVIDIVGFISLDPRLSIIHDSDELSSDLEIQTHHPPASIVPRLHAIKINVPNNSILNKELLDTSSFQTVRAELHKILSHLLFNDQLAADYLICHLISSVYRRNDYVCLGSFPLNITNFPSIKDISIDEGKNVEDKEIVFSKILYLLLSMILPKSVFVDCTLENLNELSFVPKKDYECDRLTSGILQLSANTHLIIDETKLTSGPVSENGKMNYNAISNIIKDQKINYDFKYYQMSYETDIPILILSHVKSFINGTVRVPIESSDNISETYVATVRAVSKYMNDDQLLNRIRNYLNTLKFMDFTISTEIANVIQDDLVELKSSNTQITADDFHRCLVFSRLMALSHGEDNLTIDYWKKSLSLEKERMSRISKLKEKLNK